MPDLQQTIRRQQVLGDLGALALRSENLDDLLTEACRLAGHALGTSRAKVLEIQDGGTELLVRAGVGWSPDIVGHARVTMAATASEAFSIRQRQPVVVSDIDVEKSFEIPAFMREAGVVAFVNVPIFVPGGEAYGLLEVDALEPRTFAMQDVTFLQTYTAILGPIIDRLRKIRSLHASEQRFRLIVEGARDYAIFTTDAEDRIDGWYPGAESVFGWTAAEAIGQSGGILFTPEDLANHEYEKEIEVARRIGFAANVRWHRRKDGETVFIDGAVRALRDAGNTLCGFVKVGQDVTARRLADDRLRESEARYRALIEGVPQLVWRAVNGGHWTWASPQWTAFTGQPATDSVGSGWLEAVHPEDREQVVARWKDAERIGSFEADYRIYQAARKRYGWFQTRATPVREETGHIVEWLGTSTDVDELRRLQERQRILVAELQHRTRNLLGVVRSVAQQTMRASDTLKTFEGAFNARLSALSRVQGLLSRSDDEPITMEALIRSELEALGASALPGRVEWRGPEVNLRKGTVQTFALALHELATNALKYGALATETGRLEVTWRTYVDRTGERLALDWREIGLDRQREEQSPATKPGGYGRELIERALPYALKARTTYTLGETELRCTIDLPLADGEVQKGR